MKELHFDPQIWGSDSTKIQPNRFNENAKLAKSPSYRPWGGGHTLCPGRLFARRSINAFVAILLSRYELEAEFTNFPKADGARPSPDVILVAQGQDVRLRCTPRF
jgi:cytochrome P450